MPHNMTRTLVCHTNVFEHTTSYSRITKLMLALSKPLPNKTSCVYVQDAQLSYYHAHKHKMGRASLSQVLAVFVTQRYISRSWLFHHADHHNNIVLLHRDRRQRVKGIFYHYYPNVLRKMLHIRIRKHSITNKLLVYIHLTLKCYGLWNLHKFLFHEFGHVFKKPIAKYVFPVNYVDL